MAQKNIYVCLHNNYHIIKMDAQEDIAPSVASNTLHLGLNMRYNINDIDSIVFIRPKFLHGFKVGWESLIPHQQFQYILPPMRSKTALYNIKKTGNSPTPAYGVNLQMNFNNPDSLRLFITQYAKRTKNWKLTMRTLTKGRRIPAYNRYVTSGHGGFTQDSNDISFEYSDLFKGKNLDQIHRALFYWQNFTPDTEPPLTETDSLALPTLPIFGTIDFNSYPERYQLSLPQKGLTCLITPINDNPNNYLNIKGYTMNLTFNRQESSIDDAAQEAYQSLVGEEDKFFQVQLNENTLTITNYFQETGEDGNPFPISISYDEYIQRLVILDLEWNRPLTYYLMNQ
ncbi:MAG: hypothetical protein IJL54_04520 [Prevotella sp.]|nr:hypothetical protein [Prevotella sp.]